MIFDSHEAGGWKAVYVSATAGEVTGADVERGIELFNRKSVDRGLREWTASGSTWSLRPSRSPSSGKTRP